MALRIGYVPEHFSTPLHFARRHYALDATLVLFPSGTGHMIEALHDGQIDVAIGLTEGWIAGLGRPDAPGNGGSYRIVGTYVETPLCWAISTGVHRSNLQDVSQLRHAKIGVSRIGSGSYVMGTVLAGQQGWLQQQPTETANPGEHKGPSPPFAETVVLHDFASLRRAVNDGTADFFLWEYFTSKKYYDAGEIRRLGEIYTPWSSWKIVASTSLLESPDGPSQLRDLFQRLDRGIAHFRTHPDEAIRFISTEMDYSDTDAREWLHTVRFPAATKGVDLDVVRECMGTLQKAGVLVEGRGMIADEMVANV